MKYTKLYGLSDRTTEELNSIEEVAKFIMKEGLHSDVKIITEEGEFLLDTFGIFINKISDMEYRKQLLKVLIPMQTIVKMEELVKIKIYSMDETIYFVEIPCQFYDKDIFDIWIAQNFKNVDHWEHLETIVKMKELVKIKICSMDRTIYFVEIPYQIYEKDMVDIWVSQNLRNVDYWEYWK